MVSTAFNTEIMNAIFHGSSVGVSTWYLGISNESVSTNGVVNDGAEPTATVGYSRMELPCDSSAWNLVTENGKLYAKNASTIKFPYMTEDFVVSSIFLSREATGTTCEMWQNLSSQIRVDANCLITISAGALKICLVNASNNMT